MSPALLLGRLCLALLPLLAVLLVIEELIMGCFMLSASDRS